MLPQLIKNKREALKNSYEKLPSAQKDRPSEYETQKYNNNSSKQNRNNKQSVSSQKVRTGGGFNKYTPEQPYQASFNKNTSGVNTAEKFAKFQKMKNNGNNLAAEIKMIERKIKACQKKIQEDKKRQKMLAEQATRDRQEPQYDFERVVRREMEMQGYLNPVDEDAHNFDYLTNPGGKIAQEEEIQPLEPAPVPVKKYNIEEGLEKLQKHYENSLKRKFERRQMFPHQACRRKNPKLYISHKTNTVNKYGRAVNQAQHLFRVYTKETTPQQIYPTIPNFAVVKDNLSKNIVAYLGDYKPFLEKTKNQKVSDSDAGIQNMGDSKNLRESRPGTGEGERESGQQLDGLQIQGQEIERT